MNSAIYTGTVRHRRHEPVEHAFTYRHAMVLLDLDELPDALAMGPLASASGFGLARFRREDYFGGGTEPLADAVRDLVKERTGSRPSGPVRLLTTLRTFGRAFNPVSFYYCLDAAGDRVEAVVADVTNTPWGERHAYVLDRDGEDAVMRDTMDKVFHVSPFIGMDGTYEWRVTEPGERLSVHIDERGDDDHHVFDATLALERRPLTRGQMARLLARFPATSLRVGLLIYWNAVRLKLKGAPYFANPSGAPIRRSKRAARAKEHV